MAPVSVFMTDKATPAGAPGKPPSHYAAPEGMTPFDIIDAYGLDFFEGNALKYLLRWRKKNGVDDLRKAIHYIEESIARAERG